MIFKHLFFILFFAFAANTAAQKTNLTITDSLSNVIELAYIKIYCNNDYSKINGYYIVRNGHFIITNENSCRNMRIEVTAPGYRVYYRDIQASDYQSDTLICILSRNDVKDLQPVIVTAKSVPVQIKQDTTIYKVKAFSDGTEQRLIDILEKLPGIEVNKKSGEVKFKGKPIETILLEGDNLFGANYTLASKNINASIITEVQAIENYSENYVLKGLENEEKVALNIKLTKKKLKVSGNSEIGLGVQSNQTASDVNSNLLGLGHINKFFTTASYNNVGLNKSPVDYFGGNQSIEQIRDKKYAAQKFINEPSFAAGDDKNYSNINSQLFASYNTNFKVAKKVTIKGNFYILSDKIYNRQNFDNQYFLTGDTIITTDNTAGQKRPRAVKSDLNLRFSISPKSLFEATFSDTREDLQTYRTSSSNFIPFYRSNLHSDEVFNKFLATYTQRISKTQALQIELRRVNNSISQSYDVSPSLFKRNLFVNDRQISNFEREFTHLTATLFGVADKIRYNVFLKGIYDKNKYNSAVINSDNGSDINSKVNNIIYRKPALVQGSNFNFDFKKFKFTTSYSLTFLNQNWRNAFTGIQLSNEDFLFEPSLKVKYVLTKISSISLQYSYSVNNLTDQYLYSELIIQNFRNVTSNLVDLSLVKRNSIYINYSRSDLFNQLDNGIGIGFQNNNRDYLPIYNITDTILFTTFSMEAVNNKALDVYAYVSKYIPKMKASIRLSANSITNFYNNFLAAGILRANIYNSTTAVLFFKTMFNGKFNFETENSLTVSSGRSTVGNPVSNTSYNSNSKFILTANKKIKMFVVGDYYLPNLSSKKGNLFLNYNLSFKPDKEKIEVKFIANNITNTLSFFQYQVSDFSRSVFSINTLPRTVLICLSFKF